VEHYLTVERPVVLRNAVRPELREWRQVFERLRRDAIIKAAPMRTLRLENSSIPYAETFGVVTHNEVPLGDYLEYMRHDALAQSEPGYIFKVCAPFLWRSLRARR
jgi:hypothetical protein